MTNTNLVYSDIEITAISEWIPVSKIPSSGSKEQETLDEKYGKVGVYQIALTSDIEEIGDALVHPKIAYTGKSRDIITRTYNIRQPSGSHGAGRHIRQQGYDKDADVRVRYLYTSADDFSKSLLVGVILNKSIFNEIFTNSLLFWSFLFATFSPMVFDIIYRRTK
jgi:hypothetical protein